MKNGKEIEYIVILKKKEKHVINNICNIFKTEYKNYILCI